MAATTPEKMAMNIQAMVDRFDPTGAEPYQEIASTAIMNMTIALNNYRIFTKDRHGELVNGEVVNTASEAKVELVKQAKALGHKTANLSWATETLQKKVDSGQKK